MAGLPPILIDPLPYVERLARRALDSIDTLVIHCTELPDLATARSFGERIQYAGSQTGNSGHFYVDRDGSLHEWVEPARTAHHCRGWNARSIGIELVNRGRWPDWLASTSQRMDDAYPQAQLDALMELLNALQAQLPSLRHVAGHEDLDTEEVASSDDAAVLVRRKLDPGIQFPWQAVLDATGLQRVPAGTQPDRL